MLTNVTGFICIYEKLGESNLKIKGTIMNLKNTLAAAIAALTFSGAAIADTVKVAVWYTDPAAQLTGDISTRVDSLISTANRIYENNDLDIQLELVDSRQYSSSDLLVTGDNLAEFSGATYLDVDITPTWEEWFDYGYAQQQRDLYEADMVILLGKANRVVTEEGTYLTCGVGYVGTGSNGVMDLGSNRLAYSITAVDCGATDLTFVHELGHNMGLNHSRRQGDTSGGVYYYGLGYGVDNSFSTIMGYPQSFGDAERLDTFSNPDKICNGSPCGIRNNADAQRALGPIVDDIAGYN
ncbi:zinc-dependent metalloprotease family protein [Microbulbifer sp. CnH-101-G]|uniref:zinc-dependent metalloprotease family protein n=1 Tax=Microbulbifer sp. CnH-101-G TaxID=3243393 RepID=UPI0040392F53